MGLIDDIVAGAIGYGIASARDSKIVGDIIDNNIRHMTLEEMIENYAQRHLDVYTYDNRFAHRLHAIARKYEEYNYDSIYGDNSF
jgi:hypothetical protein